MPQPALTHSSEPQLRWGAAAPRAAAFFQRYEIAALRALAKAPHSPHILHYVYSQLPATRSRRGKLPRSWSDPPREHPLLKLALVPWPATYHLVPSRGCILEIFSTGTR